MWLTTTVNNIINIDNFTNQHSNRVHLITHHNYNVTRILTLFQSNQETQQIRNLTSQTTHQRDLRPSQLTQRRSPPSRSSQRRRSLSLGSSPQRSSRPILALCRWSLAPLTRNSPELSSRTSQDQIHYTSLSSKCPFPNRRDLFDLVDHGTLGTELYIEQYNECDPAIVE